MLNRTSVVCLVGVAILALAGIAVGLGVIRRSQAGGPPNPGADVHPGFVGQTPPPLPSPRPVPALHAALVSADSIIQTIESSASATAGSGGDTIEPGSLHATLETAGELGNRNFASDYEIWVVTMSGSFRQFSAPPGAPPSHCTERTSYFDAYTGAPLNTSSLTCSFLPTQTPTP